MRVNAIITDQLLIEKMAIYQNYQTPCYRKDVFDTANVDNRYAARGEDQAEMEGQQC